MSEFTSRFEAGELDQVILAYNHYVSVIAQVPVIEQLLPITPPETEIVDERDIIFEPSPQDILKTLLKNMFRIRYMFPGLIQSPENMLRV